MMNSAQIDWNDNCNHLFDVKAMDIHLEEPLLSRPVIKSLKLVTIHPSLNTIRSKTQPYDPKKEMLDLFTGLGIFGEEYSTLLCAYVRPYSVSIP